MKKTIIKLALSAALFSVSGVSLTSCSKSDDGTPPTNNPGNPNPGNPNSDFDAINNLVITITDTDYEPGDDEVYVDYHVRNKHTTQSYNINDGEWDILFKVKATDGYQYSERVNVLSIEAESDYTHGLPIDVSTGKTIDLNTLTFEVVPDDPNDDE